MEFKDDIDNECGFHIEKKGAFCSPADIVDKLAELILDTSPKNDKIILKSLKDKYSCNTEVCVLTQPEVIQVIGQSTEKIIEEHFKPDGPRDNNRWLSNTDIDSVLIQIQKKYVNKHFLHIEFQMIDFETTQSELAKLDWPAKYKEGFRTFGAVFNTDTSRGRGQHWFAIYANFEDNASEFTLEYFNSSGELPMNQISTWMKRVKHKWQSAFNKSIQDIIVTRIVNQQDNWNCGAYSLYYIISRLDGTPYQYFKNNAIGDSNMQEFRKYLFRKD